MSDRHPDENLGSVGWTRLNNGFYRYEGLTSFSIKEEMQAMRETIEALEAERAALRETITEWEILATNLQDVLKKAPEQ